MDRKTFLIALLAFPALFYEYEKREVKPVIKVNGRRLRRGNPPPEPWKPKPYKPMEVRERVYIDGIDVEAINEVDIERKTWKHRKWKKNYNPQPLQYWGTEPIEDIDLLG